MENQITDSTSTQVVPVRADIPPLWAHQRNAIEKAENKFALFFDPGTGKTRTAIEILNATFRNFCLRHVLIFAPLNVCRNWQDEIDKYFVAPENEQLLFPMCVVSGQTKAKKIKLLKDFIQKSHGGVRNWPRFLICNIELLRSSDYLALLKTFNFQTLIVDESHNFKTHNSKQTKGLLELVKVKMPTFLYLLTGTPAPQGEMDLWSTFYLLGKCKEPFFVWRKRHFDDRNERRRGALGYWPDFVIRPESRQLFQKLLSECSLTARKDEVLDLPEMLYTNVFAELSAEQKRHYDTMKEYLFAIDEHGNELNAANLLSRTLRLQQIVAGLLGDVPMRDNPRLQALDHAIEKTQGEQFIIWTIFKATYKQIAEKLEKENVSFGMLTGEQSAEERHETIGRFQAGELRALIANPKAGGVGVNLTAASYSIYYTKNFSLTDDLQAEARNYRGGSERHKRITRIDIIAPDTVDEDITKALREKKGIQEFILGLKRRYA